MSRRKHPTQIRVKWIWRMTWQIRKRKTFAQHSAEVELQLKWRSIRGMEDRVAVAVDRAPVGKVLVHVMDLSDRVLQDYQCKS